MTKQTLLQIVQDIMSDMNSDSVTSINDTPESLRVAQIVQSVFFEMIDSRNWPHLRTITQLTDGTASLPTKMAVATTIKEIESIRYNKRKAADTKDKYEIINYLAPEDFLDKVNKRDSAATNVTVVTDYGNTKLNIRNDKQPEWWTSFDDENIYFDSFATADEASGQAYLHGDNTQMMVYQDPTFSLTDAFTPDLPDEAFSGLIAEAKSACFLRIKQAADEKAEQQSRRQQRWLSRKAWKTKGGVKYPDFGRTRFISSTTRSKLIDKDVKVT